MYVYVRMYLIYPRLRFNSLKMNSPSSKTDTIAYSVLNDDFFCSKEKRINPSFNVALELQSIISNVLQSYLLR